MEKIKPFLKSHKVEQAEIALLILDNNETKLEGWEKRSIDMIKQMMIKL